MNDRNQENPVPQPVPAASRLTLRAHRLGLDTHQQPVVCLHRDSPVARAEGFNAMSRVRVSRVGGEQSILATLAVVHGEFITPDQAGLSEIAWAMLACHEGESLKVTHPRPLESFSFVRAKLYGKRLTSEQLNDIIRDIATGRYSDVQLSGFVTACANNNLDRDEIVALTRAMADAGHYLTWDQTLVADKHCIGGIPGNRTTPIVVAIVAAAGITIPKTSSRAITSPAGTADTMATLTTVDLSLERLRDVVLSAGGCLAWGGAMNLSPADDMLIRIERALDLDSEGQLIASVLSKKFAAGSSHVLIDIPVGPSAKARSPAAGERLKELFDFVGQALGLTMRIVETDGRQPIGRGIGPALEARDVLQVLGNHPDAPQDLRKKSLHLAAELIALCRPDAADEASQTARSLLSNGQALAKFQEICQAQGGLLEPPVATHKMTIECPRDGSVVGIDNRRISRLARLAGAPGDAAAGLDMLASIGDTLTAGQPMLCLHADSPGALQYALDYYHDQQDVIKLGET